MNYQDNLKGKFIVLDGIDKAGKTTVCKLLADSLRNDGLDVETYFDPYTPNVFCREIYEVIKRYKNEISSITEMLLFTASRAELAKEIKASIDAGKTVLCDRYFLSTYVYQGLSQQIPIESMIQINGTINGTLYPDLILILDISLETFLTRSKNEKLDTFEEDVKERFKAYRSEYLKYAYQGLFNFDVINSNGSSTEILDLILNALKWRFQNV